MRLQKRQPGRAGFTIVELMVSMALIVFIMYVLAEAFSAGAKTFRDLKAIGDMNERLRSATSTMRRLLAADHFEGRKRLSDQNFWNDGPPKQGFFRIWQSDGGTQEGTDYDGQPSFRTNGHHLHFTVKLRGNSRGDFFLAKVATKPTFSVDAPLMALPQPDGRYQDAPGVFTSQWAEIAIFLKGTGEKTEDPNNAGSQLDLHALHLRQRLLVPSNKEVEDAGKAASCWPVPVTDAAGYLEVSQMTDPTIPGPMPPQQLYFNSPEDITMPARRFGNTTAALDHPLSPGSYNTLATDNASLAGSDVLLTDVLSMDIRVLLDKDEYSALSRSEEFVDFHESSLAAASRLIENRYLTTRPAPATFGTARVFDTWSSRKDDSYDYSTKWNTSNNVETIPMWTSNSNTIKPIRIRAIKITLRIWDAKTKQSRQVSMVQDL